MAELGAVDEVEAKRDHAGKEEEGRGEGLAGEEVTIEGGEDGTEEPRKREEGGGEAAEEETVEIKADDVGNESHQGEPLEEGGPLGERYGEGRPGVDEGGVDEGHEAAKEHAEGIGCEGREGAVPDGYAEENPPVDGEGRCRDHGEFGPGDERDAAEGHLFGGLKVEVADDGGDADQKADPFAAIHLLAKVEVGKEGGKEGA